MLRLSALLLLSGSTWPVHAADPNGAEAVPLIGYTELRTNLPGGRHANVRTMRATIVKADGTGRKRIGEGLAKEDDSWTQFAGWSPDGKSAIIGVGWQSPENAKWEEEKKQFRMDEGNWKLDSWPARPRFGEGRERDRVDPSSMNGLLTPATASPGRFRSSSASAPSRTNPQPTKFVEHVGTNLVILRPLVQGSAWIHRFSVRSRHLGAGNNQ